MPSLDDLVHPVRVLAGTRLPLSTRPDRWLSAGRALRRWGPTFAGGYAAAAARWPDAPAVIDDHGSITWGALHRASNALARALQARGVGEGDPVAVMCRNHRGFLLATAALGKLGADALYLNTGFAAPQVTDVLARESARAVLYDAEFAPVVHPGSAAMPRIVTWADGPTDDPTIDDLVRITADDDLPAPQHTGRIIVLTSGTTGAPKGAPRGQGGNLEAAVALLSRIPLRARETTVVGPPLFHSWGLAHASLALLLGTTLVLRRHFDPRQTLADIEAHQAQALVVVPVMLQRLLDLPAEERREFDTRSLRVVASSGSALPPALATRFMDAFGDVLYNLYGSTEVAWATIANPHDLRAAPGTTGFAPRGTVVELLDDAGAPVARGGTGNIYVGNASLFEGYTGGGSKAVAHGLMASGDLGRLDDAGRLFVVGRADDMVISGGENVFPGEIEDLLHAHPAIADVAVVGVADPDFGQRLKAFVVPAPGATITAEDVRDHVRANLARYKVPRDVEIVAELPRNATGKVLKRDLS